MATVYRVTAIWGGFQGAPGYTKFCFSDLVDNTTRQAAGTKVQTLFESLKGFLMTGWTVQVQQQIDEFDVSTGALTGASTMTTLPTLVTGNGASSNYAGGSGYCLTWNTLIIFNRRRVRGRTFMVPAVQCFATDGTLSPAAETTIKNAANAFVTPTSPRPAVWSRQFTKPPKPVQIGGQLATIDSYSLRDMASQLRSRRL